MQQQGSFHLKLAGAIDFGKALTTVANTIAFIESWAEDLQDNGKDEIYVDVDCYIDLNDYLDLDDAIFTRICQQVAAEQPNMVLTGSAEWSSASIGQAIFHRAVYQDGLLTVECLSNFGADEPPEGAWNDDLGEYSRETYRLKNSVFQYFRE